AVGVYEIERAALDAGDHRGDLADQLVLLRRVDVVGSYRTHGSPVGTLGPVGGCYRGEQRGGRGGNLSAILGVLGRAHGLSGAGVRESRKPRLVDSRIGQ